jgi:hypothetical protein
VKTLKEDQVMRRAAAERKAMLETLEQYIDRYRLDGVLDAMSDICHAKAEHLEANWQDADSASWWRDSAYDLNRWATRKGWWLP